MTTHTSSASVEVLRLQDDCNHVHYLLQKRMHSRIIKGEAHQADAEVVQHRFPEFFLWAAWGCCTEYALAFSSEI